MLQKRFPVENYWLQENGLKIKCSKFSTMCSLTENQPDGALSYDNSVHTKISNFE